MFLIIRNGSFCASPKTQNSNSFWIPSKQPPNILFDQKHVFVVKHLIVDIADAFDILPLSSSPDQTSPSWGCPGWPPPPRCPPSPPPCSLAPPSPPFVVTPCTGSAKWKTGLVQTDATEVGGRPALVSWAGNRVSIYLGTGPVLPGEQGSSVPESFGSLKYFLLPAVTAVNSTNPACVCGQLVWVRHCHSRQEIGRRRRREPATQQRNGRRVIQSPQFLTYY